MEQLIIELNAPAETPQFRVDLDTKGWRLIATGYEDGWIRDFNAALSCIRDEYSATRIFQSFHFYSQVLRGDPSGYDSELALFFRLWLSEEGDVSPVKEILAAEKMVCDVTVAESMQPASLDYLGPAEQGGIDAEFPQITELPGGGGDRVQVCLVDRGYHVCHPSLPQEPGRIACVEGTVLGPDELHGTWCLGVLVGQSSTGGGIVRNLKKCWIAAADSSETVTVGAGEEVPPLGVIHSLDRAMAAQVLEPGDVLLVPMETSLEKPVEVNSDVLGYFQKLYDEGIIVVEAAGNKGKDIATFEPGAFNGPADDPRHSRAVMVGGGKRALGPSFMSAVVDSNYGERVDCQGWGEDITTTEPDPSCERDPSKPCEDLYTHSFRASSGASSMVAGVVALVQSVQKAAYPNLPLSPLKMREALRGATVLGAPLPDIRDLLWHFDLLPNVYLRKDKYDEGEAVVGAGQAPFEALDIIPRRQEESDPDGAFIDNGNWDRDLGRDLNQGDPSWIYLRVQNGGPFEDEPTIRLYWAKPGAESSPNEWEQIAGEFSESLGPGEKKVLGGWKWEDTPVVGELCLIAVVQSKFHDTPGFANPPLTASDLSFLHEHRKITYRRVKTKKPCGCLLFWKDLFG